MFDKYMNNLEGILLAKEKYKPFPEACDREAWEALSDEAKGKYIQAAEKDVEYEWPALKAVRYMDYRRNGDRSRYQSIYFKRRKVVTELVIAECITKKGDYIDEIINGIWCICEESSWVLPAHNQHDIRIPCDALPDTSKPCIIDLFSAETAGLLATTYYLLKSDLDRVNPIICNRIENELKKRIIDPFLYDDFFWMGFNCPRVNDWNSVNNWNPWCNSNCLLTVLLMEEDSAKRANSVEKAMRSLEIYLNSYSVDGGCDEGASYWGRAGGSLFDCLEMLYTASCGVIDVFKEPMIMNIGRYINKVHISGEYFVNFADGNAKPSVPFDLIYRYGRRINDSMLSSLGIILNELNLSNLKFEIDSFLQRQIPYLFCFDEMVKSKKTIPFERDVWIKDIQVMAAREKYDSSNGLYLAAKGGHNAESHNHNDIGQYIVYLDGYPVIIDPGVESYTSKTFSSSRYDIWTMQSQYHNLPVVNGVMQQNGRNYSARDVSYKMSDWEICFSLDISGAYPVSAEMKYWNRSFKFIREDNPCIEVSEDVCFHRKTSDVTIVLMTLYKPVILEEGAISLDNEKLKNLRILFERDQFEVSVEPIELHDEHISKAWGERIYRLLFNSRHEIDSACWKMKITC